MRYRLRTLLILLAVLPPLLWIGWTKYGEWKAEQERREAQREPHAGGAVLCAALARRCVTVLHRAACQSYPAGHGNAASALDA